MVFSRHGYPIPSPYPYSWIELPLYTRTRLILTFVVMSRWTTLALRQLMWNLDSRELPRGGWISCTFVGHPEGLWVHYLPRVLDM
jgi:hypothetical protein